MKIPVEVLKKAWIEGVKRRDATFKKFNADDGPWGPRQYDEFFEGRREENLAGMQAAAEVILDYASTHTATLFQVKKS